VAQRDNRYDEASARAVSTQVIVLLTAYGFLKLLYTLYQWEINQDIIKETHNSRSRDQVNPGRGDKMSLVLR
jgi:hypothetical protein